jgi:hypothetical protein
MILTITETIDLYKQAVSNNNPALAENLVLKLKQSQRIVLRKLLVKMGVPTVQPLYFDYEKQEWF